MMIRMTIRLGTGIVAYGYHSNLDQILNWVLTFVKSIPRLVKLKANNRRYYHSIRNHNCQTREKSRRLPVALLDQKSIGSEEGNLPQVAVGK